MDNITGVIEDFNEANQSASIRGFYGSAASLLKAASVVDLFYTPLICLFGVVGNCLSVVVFFTNGSHRQLSSAFYLSALAITDTGFLLNLFAFWLDEMVNGMILSTNLGCSLVMFTGQVFCFLSVWLTVGFTVERYFAVSSPLSRRTVCTVSKAKKVTLALTVTALIIFSYVVIIARAVPKDQVFSQFRDNRTLSPLLHKLNNFTNPNPNFPAALEFDTNPQEDFGSTDKLPLQRNESGNPINSRQYAEILHSLETSSEWDYTNETAEYPSRNSLCAAESDHRLSRGFRNTRGESKVLLEPQQESLKSETPREHSEGSSPSTSTPEYFESVGMNEVVEESSYDERNESTDETYPRISTSPTRHICTVPTQFLTISIIANYIDSMITLIIPFCLIAYFNMRIIVCVMNQKEERKKLVAAFNMIEHDAGSKRIADGSDSNNSQGDLEDDNELENNVKTFSKSSFALKRVNAQRRKPTNHLAQRISGRESIKRIVCQDSIVRSPRNHGKNCPATKRSTRTDDMKKQSLILNCMRGKTVQWGRGSSVRSRGIKGSTLKKTLLKGQSSSIESRHKPQLVRSSDVPFSETRVTKMLLLVSSVFLLLNLPSHAIQAVAFIQNLVWTDDREGLRMIHAAQQLSNILLFNTSFAVNFLLYCLSGKNFRQSLRKVLFGRRKSLVKPFRFTPSVSSRKGICRRQIGTRDDHVN